MEIFFQGYDKLAWITSAQTEKNIEGIDRQIDDRQIDIQMDR